MSEVSELRTDLFGKVSPEGRVISEGHIPKLEKQVDLNTKSISNLRLMLIAAICLGVANGAGQLAGGGGWPI